MKCPSCAKPDTRVIDSRLAHEGEAVRRRRECEACGRRFTTFERFEAQPPVVVKKDGRREPFDRGKILAGLMTACRKRPVSHEQLEGIADRIEREISEKAMGGEIRSEEIGARIMGELSRLDQVAYVRFASVYKEFRDIDQFMDELKGIQRTEVPKAPGEKAS